MISSPISIAEIASKVGGTVHGDGARTISSIRPLEIAEADDLSFFAPTSKRKTVEIFEIAKTTRAAAILVSKHEPAFPCTQIVVGHPLAALVVLAPLFRKGQLAAGIHPTAVIDPTAAVDPAASVGAYAVIGARSKIGARSAIHPHVVVYTDVEIGADCVIHAGAVIREGCSLGNDCLIQSGAVIGGDGFGYIPDRAVGHRRIPHIGEVILEDGVDLGANTTVDRATFGETRIRKNAKVDNLVMIAHNVKVGERTLLCGQVGISGSTEIGDDVILAGQVGVADHIKIGSKVRAAAKTGIGSDIEDGIDVAGYPHTEASRWRRTQVALRYLPELLKKRGLK